MKENLTTELKELFQQATRWVKLEVRYAKLTVAERATLLMGTLALALIALLIGMVILIVLAFAMADWLDNFMSPALSRLCVSGVLMLLMVLIVLLRKPIIIDPIARFLSKLIIDKD